ncbi:GntR family transcriptional regulator [Pandoraea terrae]|uniref:GntR family transcriptional regulator n=1 Tax=Pandoraea terrae TaxID=1537710 RepID=A0A5E4TP97_9BURK|nr:PLP-dependent aminotransferase family protein [Pandoraea terrae]VVD89645.1 GntR family transcriptional regulator [Pandoraea terrae]
MPQHYANVTLSPGALSDHRESTLLDELRVERQRGISLVEQIVGKLDRLVESGRLKPGTKTPSVRELAKALGVSTFTITEAYEVLVSRRILNSRPGSGYFVASRTAQMPVFNDAPSKLLPAGDTPWTSVQIWNEHPDMLPVGCGWLPPEWCSESMLLQALRQATRMPAQRLVGYGHPLGFRRLRHMLARDFSERFCTVSPDQIVLTNGVTHGLDLVMRNLVRMGDTVLVEDPGYFYFHDLLRKWGINVVGVRRTGDGLDADALARLAALHRPKAIFVNTALQNPLSTTLSMANAHRVIALAEQYDFWIVEDDIFRDLCGPSDASLAALDGFNRVICIGGFSKTIAPSLRVGYVLCPERLLSDLLHTKMICGLTTSELNERCVFELLSDPSHRRYIDRLRTRLSNDRERFLATLAELRMATLATPRGGLFVSAGWQVEPSPAFNSQTVVDAGRRAGIALAPGDLFYVDTPADSVWFRFNVAYCDSPKLHAFLGEMAVIALGG